MTLIVSLQMYNRFANDLSLNVNYDSDYVLEVSTGNKFEANEGKYQPCFREKNQICVTVLSFAVL